MPGPVLPMTLAVIAGLLVSSSAPAGAEPVDQDPVADTIFPAPGETVNIPLHLETDQPVLEVMIHGEGPYRFLLLGRGGERVTARLTPEAS